MTRPTSATPRPITYADLAEFAEANNLPGAAHLRESADAEAAGRLEGSVDAQEVLDDWSETLSQIPEPAKSTKHSDTCWQRHAKCLADRLTDAA